MNFPPNTVRTTTPSPLGTLTLAASPTRPGGRVVW